VERDDAALLRRAVHRVDRLHHEFDPEHESGRTLRISDVRARR
jgi:hypothetical protein